MHSVLSSSSAFIISAKWLLSVNNDIYDKLCSRQQDSKTPRQHAHGHQSSLSRMIQMSKDFNSGVILRRECAHTCVRSHLAHTGQGQQEVMTPSPSRLLWEPGKGTFWARTPLPSGSPWKLAYFIYFNGFRLPGKKHPLLHLNNLDVDANLIPLGRDSEPSAFCQACCLLCTQASEMAFCISGFMWVVTEEKKNSITAAPQWVIHKCSLLQKKYKSQTSCGNAWKHRAYFF